MSVLKKLSSLYICSAHSLSGSHGTIKPLTPPHPIRPERSRLAVERFLTEAKHNRAPECRLYLPSEGKFLCVTIDTNSGKHFLRLLEGDRMWPTETCGIWRAIPADRTSKDKLMLLQVAVYYFSFLASFLPSQCVMIIISFLSPKI
jgi:hypothetical protein